MKYIIPFAEITDCDVVGGKAWSLVRLRRAGFPVPSGWVIPSAVFHAQLAAWGFVAGDADADLRAGVQHGEFCAELLHALAALPALSWAVRSSATAEDSAGASYSGIFASVLGVHVGPALADAVRAVWASAFTPAALAYHRQLTGSSGYPAMAVLLQPMVAARSAGVAFSAHPLDGHPFRIAISASHGLGSTVVNGREPVDRYLLDWDSLALLEQELAGNPAGEFLTGGGDIVQCTVDSSAPAVLDAGALQEIGRLAREVDGLFDARVDIEFAVTADGVILLQARPIVGLPAYFPHDPRFENTKIYCCHHERMAPLSPYARSTMKGSIKISFPLPPWPMEVAEVCFQHGRAFAVEVENPELTECPQASWEDRGFLRRMLACDDPAACFREWCRYADLVYGELIPLLRARAERTLRYTTEQLRAQPPVDFLCLLEEMLQLDGEAGMLYLATSYPTAETLRRIELLIRDALQLPWQESQQIALTMIQGAPKLTHLRDADVEQAAQSGQLEEVIAQWGYSYLRRDELLDISSWQSWREDPTPLEVAVANLGKSARPLSIQACVHRAMDESEARFPEVVEMIRGSAHGGEHYARVFTACVDASRRLFLLKDDRDLVFSHAQAAVRWVLGEAGRRLVQAGGLEQVEDIYLLRPEEIVAGIAGDFAPEEITALARLRRDEQRRFARYTLPTAAICPHEPAADGDWYVGAPASAGIAEGPVRIVTTERLEEIAQLQPGEILWLRGEAKVGWTMYFPLIAGLIYAGNWLCHETNLCRELGIPAIIGIGDIPEIRSGDRLRIDGRKGRLYRLA